MLFDTTYTDKETIRKINETVGNSFSWRERLRMKGIGSGRMKIEAISDEYKKYLNAEHYASNANIELRPKGILIHFRHKLQVYTWVMPYTSLKIEYPAHLRLECDGKFIQFNDPANHDFIRRLITLSQQ